MGPRHSADLNPSVLDSSDRSATEQDKLGDPIMAHAWGDRHAVNYQDSMTGGGLVEGNLFFNLNRESKDTSAFNSWGRREYQSVRFPSLW